MLPIILLRFETNAAVSMTPPLTPSCLFAFSTVFSTADFMRAKRICPVQLVNALTAVSVTQTVPSTRVSVYSTRMSRFGVPSTICWLRIFS